VSRVVALLNGDDLFAKYPFRGMLSPHGMHPKELAQGPISRGAFRL